MQLNLITLKAICEFNIHNPNIYLPDTREYISTNGYRYRNNGGTITFYKYDRRGTYNIVLAELHTYFGHDRYYAMSDKDIETFLQQNVLDFY